MKVNQKFVDDLLAAAQSTSTNKRGKKAADVEALIADDRFKSMFEDEEFKRDMNTEAGQRAQLTSSTGKAAV